MSGINETGVLGVANIILGYFNNKDKQIQDAKMHSESINILKKHQNEELLELRRTYIMSSFHDMERHFQQLNSDLIQGAVRCFLC